MLPISQYTIFYNESESEPFLYWSICQIIICKKHPKNLDILDPVAELFWNLLITDSKIEFESSVPWNIICLGHNQMSLWSDYVTTVFKSSKIPIFYPLWYMYLFAPQINTTSWAEFCKTEQSSPKLGGSGNRHFLKYLMSWTEYALLWIN